MFFHMLEDCWLTCGIERTKNNPWGLKGGGEARPNRAGIRHRDGRYEEIDKATGLKVPKGATFELSTGGGGGYGPPSERDSDAVIRDVREGYVTEALARSQYPHVQLNGN
jgi:N-methylhydantoinase B